MGWKSFRSNMAKKCEHDRIKSTCSVCSVESVYHQYERKARERNLTFRLTLEEFKQIVQQQCHYCGLYAGQEVMGIDRVDNRIGYLKSNCVAACQECNFAKRAMLAHRFIAMALRIAKHQESLKNSEKKTGHPVSAPGVGLPESVTWDGSVCIGVGT